MENKIKEIYQELNLLYEKYKNIDYLHLSIMEISKIRSRIIELYKEYMTLVLGIQSHLPNHSDNYSLRNSNCFLYALGVGVPMPFKRTYEKIIHTKFAFDVGELSGMPPIFRTSFSKRQFLERLYADLEALKLEYHEREDEIPRNNGYVIRSYVDLPNRDFHFTRRNIDGSITHKDGYRGPIKFLDDNVKDKVYYNSDGYYEYVNSIEIVKPSFKR